MPITPYPDTLDLNKQAVLFGEAGKDGHWETTLFPSSALTTGQPLTIHELFERAAERNGSADLFRWRPLLSSATAASPAVFSPIPSSMSYATAAERRTNIGRAIVSLEQDGRLGPRGSGPSGRPTPIDELSGYGVGIWSANRAEWQLVDLAAHAFSLVGVPLYDTLGPNVVEYVVNHAPLSIVFAASSHIPALLRVAPKCASLRIVVSMDKLMEREGKVLKSWSETVGIELWEIEDLESWGAQEGAKRNIQFRPPTPQQTATISYTSGTTGNPKGVVLTHSAVTQGVVAQSLGGTIVGDEQPVLLSYLPLAHIFERFFELLMMYIDGCIAYTTGDPLRLLEDAQIMKPHLFPSVPRVLNRIHQAIMAQVHAGGVKGALLSRAINTKIENYRKTGEVTHAVYDALVFRKVRQLLGGRVVFICSGSAPISPEVLETLKACFSCDVAEGYGLTETVGTCTAGIPHDVGHLGTTGGPRVGIQLKLRDVVELNYTTADKPYPRGELLIGGPIRLSRYHRDPENTKKSIDEDGYFHTGDIASIDNAGRVKIIDRIKNVIKLSQGEYVALEKVEGVFGLHPLFSTMVVHGDGLESHIILIGICDPVQASQFVNRVLGEKIEPTDVAGLKSRINDKRMRRAVLKDLKKLAKKSGLNSFETVKGLHLELDPFPEHVLTPTLKVKRQAAAEHYREVIRAVYAEGDSLTKDEPLAAKL